MDEHGTGGTLTHVVFDPSHEVMMHGRGLGWMTVDDDG